MTAASQRASVESPEGLRVVQPGDWGRVASCLARAFEDDPVARFIFPRDATRLARLERFYRAVMRMNESAGGIYSDPEFRGASIWRVPGAPAPTRARAVLDGLSMLAILRTSTPRALRLEEQISGARPREPHWYLALLGTEPDQQGRGVGSALVAPVLERCDQEQVPAYLESSKEGNIPFYERHGFRVLDELRVHEGPRLWPMLRKPKALNREALQAE